MTDTKKTKFELAKKFQPCFSSAQPVYFTENGMVICGRTVEDSLQISSLSAVSFELLNTYTDDDKITSFVVDQTGSLLFIATKNLLLKKLELPDFKKSKVWQSAHQRPVLMMATNKDGSRLVTASGDTVIRLWHLGPKEGFTASCRAHNSVTSVLRFHPHEPYFFSSAIGDHNVIVWNAETGANVMSLEGHQSTVTDICFDSRGYMFATCGRDKVFIVWSFPEYTKLNVVPAFESLESGVFLPPGALVNHLGSDVESKELLLTGGQWGCMRVWEPFSGRCLLEIKGPLDRCALIDAGSQNRQSIDYGLHSVVSLQLSMKSSDSIPILALVRQSNHIELYDPVQVKLLSECLGDIGQVDQLCIVGKSKNHLLLADASPHLKLFPRPYGLTPSTEAAGSWICHLVPGGHSDVVTDLTVSTCGEWVCSGSKDQSICLWRVVDELASSGKLTVKMQVLQRLTSAHGAHISALCLNTESTLLMSASEDNTMKAWVVNLPCEGSSSCSISEWSVVHGAHKSSINDISISINNQFAATASRDKTVKIWAIGKRGLECSGTLQGHRRGVWSVRFSPREKLVLSASGDGDIKLWNLKDFSCIRTFEGHEQPVYRAVFLSDGRQILSCDQQGLIRLWDVGNPSAGLASEEESKSGSTSSRVYEAHDGRVWSLAVCPDESGFYTGGEDETLCYFRDITEESQEQQLRLQEEFVQTNQQLSNLMASKQFSAALRLAVKLDQPKRTLDILQDLLLTDLPTLDATNRLAPSLDGLLSSESAEESERLAQRLLTFAVNWNTRARTSTIAQYVLNWILSNWSPDELLLWPGIGRTIESLIPYTDRHYQRLFRLEEKLSILDYLCDLADEHQVSSITDSGHLQPADNVVDLTLSMDTCE